MSVKHILRDFISPPMPNYIGEEVTGELNNYQYRGFVLEKRGELYLIQSEDGTKHLIKNIRRIGDLIVRRQ